MRVGPVGFLLLVPAVWIGVRAVMLWPIAAPTLDRPAISWAKPLANPVPFTSSPVGKRADPVVSGSRLRSAREGLKSVTLRHTQSRHCEQSEAIQCGASSPGLLRRYALRDDEVAIAPEVRGVAVALPPAPMAGSRHNSVSLSAWTLVRGDVSPGLATAGQLGGSQAGLRARYAIEERVHLAARLSGPLQSQSGKEAAIALDVQPLKALPITLTVERRIGLDRGGRDAFGVGVFGGFDHVLARGLRMDGYGQAGLVGLKRRDGYVDGALRAERELLRIGGGRIGVGAGAWGGAQPGAARLDVGPQLVARVNGLRVGAEWRQRVAGDARPGSGPVLSLGADF